MSSAKPKVAFLYWGKRGLSRFALDIARQSRASDRNDILFSVSTSNELIDEFRSVDVELIPVDTFRHPIGSLNLPRVWTLCRSFVDDLVRRKVVLVVNLMPHVWTPLLASRLSAAGIRYATVIHDADPHPGDTTGSVLRWTMREMPYCDVVLTLSHAVSRRLVESGRIEANRVFPSSTQTSNSAICRNPNRPTREAL